MVVTNNATRQRAREAQRTPPNTPDDPEEKGVKLGLGDFIFYRLGLTQCAACCGEHNVHCRLFQRVGRESFRIGRLEHDPCLLCRDSYRPFSHSYSAGHLPESPPRPSHLNRFWVDFLFQVSRAMLNDTTLSILPSFSLHYLVHLAVIVFSLL